MTEIKTAEQRIHKLEGGEGDSFVTVEQALIAERDELRAAPVPEGWQPIETAPKDGVELIGWRKDCGAILIRWTSCSELMTEPEIEQSGIDDATLFSEDWFCAGGRLEGCEIPTHWMSLPAAPKEPT